jgi:hypothetical protein
MPTLILSSWFFVDRENGEKGSIWLVCVRHLVFHAI